jgi:hypothetical protein
LDQAVLSELSNRRLHRRETLFNRRTDIGADPTQTRAPAPTPTPTPLLASSWFRMLEAARSPRG